MVQDKMNWYINRKTNELVQAIWEEDVNGKDYSCWFVYKDGRKIAELNVADFQSQYGEAMICPKKDCNIQFCSSLKPHICNSGCTSPSFCPHCVCYTPEQELSDDELQEPKAGAMEMLLEATKPKPSLLLSEMKAVEKAIELQKYSEDEGYVLMPADYYKAGMVAELDHLAKLGIVYIRVKHCVNSHWGEYVENRDIPLSDYMKGEK